MVAEQIIFNTIALILFIYFFLRMIKRDETQYLNLLIMQAIGILINFCYAVFDIFSIFIFKIIVYIFAIVIPIIVLCIEGKGKMYPELLSIILAKIYMLFGNTYKAQKILNRAVKKYKDNDKIHKLLAKSYEKNGDIQTAIDEYVKTVEINKKDYESYYKIAFLLTKSENNDEAIEMLNNLIKVKPEYLDARILLGELLIKKDLYKEALTNYTDLLKYKEEDELVLYSLGIVYSKLNDFNNAKAAFEKAIELEREIYNAYYYLGQISLIFHETDKAKEYFDKSINGSLKDFACFELAKLYMLDNKKEEAIAKLNFSLSLSPEIMENIKDEPIFLTIRKDLIIPDDGNKELLGSVSKIELEVKEHLEDTYKIIGKLNYRNKRYDDIEDGTQLKIDLNENKR